MLLSRQLLGLYIADNPDAIEIAYSKMFITTLPYFLIGIMEQFGNLLNGMGKAVNSAVNALLGTCVLRVLWVALFNPMPSFNFLNLVYPVSWIATIILNVTVFLIIRKKAFK